MIERGEVSADTMVLAFLRAEIDSGRFGGLYRQHLAVRQLDPDRLISRGDVNDPVQNEIRASVLDSVRGYRSQTYLFNGFPRDASWRRVELEPGELAVLLYANYPEWVTLTGGTRRVADGARNATTVKTDAHQHIHAVARLVASGATFPELIAAENVAGSLVLLEGHTRATAYVLAKRQTGVEVLVASSPRIADWKLL